jgi:biopolymer transport protein ExbD
MIIPRIREKRRARIEIVPLIDIIFFLLATFVMVSLSMVKHQGIPVVVPQAATGQAQEKNEHTMVTLSETGQMYLNKVELSQEALFAQIRTLKEANPELRILINGDESARLGLAIRVLDETRKLGITKVAFATTPVPKP